MPRQIWVSTFPVHYQWFRFIRRGLRSRMVAREVGLATFLNCNENLTKTQRRTPQGARLFYVMNDSLHLHLPTDLHLPTCTGHLAPDVSDLPTQRYPNGAVVVTGHQADASKHTVLTAHDFKILLLSPLVPRVNHESSDAVNKIGRAHV